MILIPTFNKPDIRVMFPYKDKVYVRYTRPSSDAELFFIWDMEDLIYPDMLDIAGYTRIYSPLQMKKNQYFLSKLLG